MKVLWIFIFLCCAPCFSQNKVHSFFELSSPERWWVITHPFKVKKAFVVTQNTLKITDSIGNTGGIGKDLNGGRLDAFKHSFWMAELTKVIGKKPALKLGRAHEKGNYIAFKKGRLEEGSVPDKIASEMDLFNNEVGAKFFEEPNNLSQKERITLVVNAVKNGTMRHLKKDASGNFLTCDGHVIPKDSLAGTWENNKCLVASNRN